MATPQAASDRLSVDMARLWDVRGRVTGPGESVPGPRSRSLPRRFSNVFTKFFTDEVEFCYPSTRGGLYVGALSFL
jgi:hypothetical protein